MTPPCPGARPGSLADAATAARSPTTAAKHAPSAGTGRGGCAERRGARTPTAPDPIAAREAGDPDERLAPPGDRARRAGMGRLAVHGPSDLASGHVPAAWVPARRHDRRADDPPLHHEHGPIAGWPLTRKDGDAACLTPPPSESA